MKNRISNLLSFTFLFCFLFFTACAQDGSSSGSGSGNVTGGSLSPPGSPGTQASSLLENPLSSICQTLAGDFFVTSSGGKALTSTDGSSFTVLEDEKRDLRSSFCDRQSSSSTNVWFVGAGGVVLKYDGSNITEETSSTTEDLNSAFGTDTSNIYAVGKNGAIIHWNGTSWSVQTTPTTDNLFGVGGRSSQTNVFVVGANRTLLRNPNSSTWTAVGSLPSNVQTDTQLNAIWEDPLASGTIFVVGDAGTIMKGTSNGTVWEKQESGTSKDLLAVHGTSSTNVIAVGEDGIILAFDGVSWSQQTNPTDDQSLLQGVFMVSSSQAFAVGAQSTASNATGVILGLTNSTWQQTL